ncbi:Membrane protein involved in the export of O-antigen and teichoic acid [Pseudobutyrivibrio sp. 49]|uniref:oligosaccharide flippase family protein n=1 Tax=Pseudobutyrivibrio sp. 49 TaxID=1855344 RepID=UPI000892473C|nr:oligosaccharide flippase family protein [Pseudobutyrivibrio sp. 49]SDI72411.1 Membrane protein involved in the export of O-antigen and teichoic acid [Pseudobutyrivibrio sp. 49]
MGKKQTNKNIVINIAAFVIQLVIGLYTAPILIKSLGTESYGFIGLANDFVNYLTIITAVFNSVASRFIALEFSKNNIERAERYFNSLLATNIVLATCFGLFGLGTVVYIDRIFDVPAYLITDVRVTFAITFITFIVGVMSSIFNTAAFVKNRLDIQGYRNILQYVIRLSCIIGLLTLSQLHIYYVSIASLVAAIVVAIINVDVKRKYMPEVKISFEKASFSDVRVLASAGIWLAITNLSAILMRGLDLVVANKFLGAYDMGLLSVARTFPNSFTSAVATLAPIFTPVFIRLWAQGKNVELNEAIRSSIKTMGLIMIVPVSGFIVFSQDFYSLWQKSYSPAEIKIICVLSTITVMQCYFNSTTATMAQTSVVVNKLKLPVFVSFGCGILNLIVVFSLLKYTNLGIYSIVISSSVIMITRYILFNSYYAAYILKQSVLSFFKTCLYTWMTIPIQIVLMMSCRRMFNIHNWASFLISVAFAGVFGYIVELILIERRNSLVLIKKILGKVKPAN